MPQVDGKPVWLQPGLVLAGEGGHTDGPVANSFFQMASLRIALSKASAETGKGHFLSLIYKGLLLGASGATWFSEVPWQESEYASDGSYNYLILGAILQGSHDFSDFNLNWEG